MNLKRYFDAANAAENLALARLRYGNLPDLESPRRGQHQCLHRVRAKCGHGDSPLRKWIVIRRVLAGLKAHGGESEDLLHIGSNVQYTIIVGLFGNRSAGSTTIAAKEICP